MEFEETRATVSLHGLGFLQVKLQGDQRLHMWHPDLPRRTCFAHSSIHDHRFGFNSVVLVGTQVNVLYDVRRLENDTMEATHMAYLHEGPRGPSGNRPWTPDGTLFVTERSRREVPAGRSYNMRAYDYHATHPGGNGRVATIMTKTYQGDHGAHSLCELGAEPDVDFNRSQMSKDDMWMVVRDVLGGTNHYVNLLDTTSL